MTSTRSILPLRLSCAVVQNRYVISPPRRIIISGSGLLAKNWQWQITSTSLPTTLLPTSVLQSIRRQTCPGMLAYELPPQVESEQHEAARPSNREIPLCRCFALINATELTLAYRSFHSINRSIVKRHHQMSLCFTIPQSYTVSTPRRIFPRLHHPIHVSCLVLPF